MHDVLAVEGPYYNSHGWWVKIFNRKTYVNFIPLFTLLLITARTQLWNSNSCWLPWWWRYFLLSTKLHQRPVLAGWNWTSRRSASVRGETSLVVFPRNKTSLWARSCSCTARERWRVTKVTKVTTATGDVYQITKDSLYSWLIRTTRYWLQKHQPLVRVDGTIWPDTVLPPQSLCSVPKTSLSLSLLTASCVFGMAKIGWTAPKVITAESLAQMCMVYWRKQTTKTEMNTSKTTKTGLKLTIVKKAQSFVVICYVNDSINWSRGIMNVSSELSAANMAKTPPKHSGSVFLSLSLHGLL